ncbi:MAG TPA: RtcB family protein, partial [bacterium]|nr:RtcB family protein [bacterium]
MIHTGSRGLGHQNCSDYLRLLMPVYSKYGIKLPDKELVCVPFNSPEGQRFFKAMSAACNFAWANRHMITFYTRKAWQKVLGKNASLKLLYDVAHNIAKIEEHEVDGKKMKLIVHRKGATRAFPPFHPEIPEKYKEVGQPVLIPGTMGTASYVCVGTEKSKEAFYTVNHGAGRTMSRRQATRTISGKEVMKALEKRGIIVRCYSLRGLAEEAPLAYKDIENVVEIVHNAGLSRKVAKLKPLAVIKGE